MRAKVKPIRLEELTREEMLYLLKHECLFHISQKKLLNARWEVLGQKAEKLSDESIAEKKDRRLAHKKFEQAERLWKKADKVYEQMMKEMER